MLVMVLFIGCLTVISRLDALQLGIIYNTSLMIPYLNLTMTTLHCNICLCAMFTSSNNSSILSFNCLANSGNGVVCQFFTNAMYLDANNIQMRTNLNSIFYFRQLPVRNQSTATTASVVTTNAASTFLTTSPSTTLSSTICPTISTSTVVTSSPLPSQCSHYTLITDGTRNAANVASGGCDDTTFTVSPIWIRFSSPAGTILANCPIAPFRCGANSPGWYTGLYPSVAGETTNGTVCYTWTTGYTCIYSNQISITNCNGYYVFALIRPSTCNLRYCTI